MRVALIIGGLSVGVLFVAWLFRRRWVPAMFAPLICPVVLKRWQLLVIVGMPVLAICVALFFNQAQRQDLNDLSRARIADLRRSLDEQTLTRAQIAAIAQTQAMLLQPTTREQLRRINRALKTCASHVACRREFVRTVNTIVRSPGGVGFIPAPKGSSPVPPARTIVVQGKPGPAGAMGAPGRDGKAGTTGTPGKPGGPGSVDSNIVDGLDNRVADLEGALQSLVSRVSVLDGLVHALCRLLTPARC